MVARVRGRCPRCRCWSLSPAILPQRWAARGRLGCPPPSPRRRIRIAIYSCLLPCPCPLFAFLHPAFLRRFLSLFPTSPSQALLHPPPLLALSPPSSPPIPRPFPWFDHSFLAPTYPLPLPPTPAHPVLSRRLLLECIAHDQLRNLYTPCLVAYPVQPPSNSLPIYRPVHPIVSPSVRVPVASCRLGPRCLHAQHCHDHAFRFRVFYTLCSPVTHSLCSLPARSQAISAVSVIVFRLQVPPGFRPRVVKNSNSGFVHASALVPSRTQPYRHHHTTLTSLTQKSRIHSQP